MNHAAVICHSHADCCALICSVALCSLWLWACGEAGTVVGDMYNKGLRCLSLKRPDGFMHNS